MNYLGEKTKNEYIFCKIFKGNILTALPTICIIVSFLVFEDIFSFETGEFFNFLRRFLCMRS